MYRLFLSTLWSDDKICRDLQIEVWLETAEKLMKLRGFFSSFGRLCLRKLLS